ncbi:cell wall-binding repeat-containing protein [Lihuaxuella thermophila]|uniref:Uncharacterized protein n=1 Tax=Lihuaxuella thermophila TaxID=1173111 RepID=A0A1H8BS86_9BACL|nr:cell wall-binding repeat-containing protein [Lihuaxuella thermophila]SEM85715.1 protein of unknown function [Lihuaxuella thermophila]
MSKKWKRAVAVVGSLTLFGSFLPVSTAHAAEMGAVERLAGKDRYEVAVSVSREMESLGLQSDTVIIARGDQYPDALSGGPLAYSKKAPVLLTTPTSLPSSVQTEISRRHPSTAIILGGTGAVSTNVETQLKQLGVSTVMRLSGADRYAVSAAIAEKVVAASTSDTAIIASGTGFADALAASSIAAQKGMPILLVGTEQIPAAIQNFLNQHSEINKFIIVGGPAVVSDRVQSQLSTRGTVTRIYGSDRYQTAVNVAKHFQMSPANVTVARGDVFADALAGGPLAAFAKAPILLTQPSALNVNVESYLKAYPNPIEKIYILGGTAAVSTAAEQKLSGIVKAGYINGEKIVFVRDHDGDAAADEDIFVMNPDGTGVVNLTDDEMRSYYADVSPDGNKIVFVSDNLDPSYPHDQEIFVINADGSNLRQLTRNDVNDRLPQWSPDGSTISYESIGTGATSDIFVMNADGSNPRNLTQTADIYEHAPRWSPDGRISFTSYNKALDPIKEDIFVMNADGTGKKQLTNNPHRVTDSSPAWSADGRTLYFVRQAPDPYDNMKYHIYKMNADGTQPVILYTSAANVSGVRLSPDGQKLAFNEVMSQYPYRERIFTISVDGTGKKQVTPDSALSSYLQDWSMIKAR